MLVDIAGFTDVLQKLKAKGASPWLLKQLIAAGPTKSAIRLGQKYLSDNAALMSLNAKTSALDSLSSTYGTLTTGEKFIGQSAWSGPAVSKETGVLVSTLDKSAFASEVARIVRHDLETTAAGGGL